jgi:hypothetical protein
MNPNHPPLPVKKYIYPLGFSLYHAFFAAVFGSVILFVLGGALYLLAVNTIALVATPDAATFLGWLLGGMVTLLAVAVINAIPFLIFIGLVTTYPTINLTEKGYQLQILWYKSRWLAWDTLLHVSPFYPTRDTLHSLSRLFGIDTTHQSYNVSAAGLDRLFGLHDWMSRSSFCISPFIIGYHDLMRTLREKRPDLFYT